MTKKIAVINDLSGFGRCSLTAAISVISAMGIQPCPLPTAILTAQTGYPSYYIDDYTEKMDIYRTEWQKMGQSFDGIYTGFVASEDQIDQIFRFIDTFKTPETFLLVDPIMGDDGIKYDMFTPRLLNEMRRLVEQADIITPNLTELCLLTDEDFHMLSEVSDYHMLTEKIVELAQPLCKENSQKLIVTGIHYENEKKDAMMGNLYITKDSFDMFSFPYIGGSYSGTGDLFASCISAGVARGDAIPDMIKLAGEFLKCAMKDSVENHVPRNDGTNYEKYLHMLMPKQ